MCKGGDYEPTSIRQNRPQIPIPGPAGLGDDTPPGEAVDEGAKVGLEGAAAPEAEDPPPEGLGGPPTGGPPTGGKTTTGGLGKSPPGGFGKTGGVDGGGFHRSGVFKFFNACAISTPSLLIKPLIESCWGDQGKVLNRIMLGRS